MFKNMYDSLSCGVHLELLVYDDKVCLKTWSEIDENEFNQVNVVNDYAVTRSLAFSGGNPKYMEFVNEASGVYHKYLPTGYIFGEMIEGEKFIPNIPAGIRDNYDHLTGTYWRNHSYSLIDPTDPSIHASERDDVACWAVGVKSDDHVVNPFYNTLTDTFQTKAHPLRSLRKYTAPVSLMIYQAFKADKFTDCSMTFKYNTWAGFSTNILDGWTVGTGYDYLDQMGDAFPNFEVTSGGGDIDAGDTDTVNFKMVDKDGTTIEKNSTLYLESTGGYLPKTRVDVTNGLGSFKVTALGLGAYDTFKVKMGFRNYTGVKDVSYTVK